MAKTAIVAVFPVEAYGIAFEVAAIESGFSVVLRDTDADEVASAVLLFNDRDAALAHARTLAIMAAGGVP